MADNAYIWTSLPLYPSAHLCEFRPVAASVVSQEVQLEPLSDLGSELGENSGQEISQTFELTTDGGGVKDLA